MGYGKILLAYDGSDYAKRAFEAAIEFVDHGLADGIVALEVTSLFFDVSHIREVGGVEALLEAMEGSNTEDVALGNNILLLPGYRKDKVDTVVGYGNPKDEILRITKEKGCGLIVIGSRGLGAVRSLLGSTSYGVLVHADVPVMVIK